MTCDINCCNLSRVAHLLAIFLVAQMAAQRSQFKAQDHRNEPRRNGLASKKVLKHRELLSTDRLYVLSHKWVGPASAACGIDERPRPSSGLVQPLTSPEVRSIAPEYARISDMAGQKPISKDQFK